MLKKFAAAASAIVAIAVIGLSERAHAQVPQSPNDVEYSAAPNAAPTDEFAGKKQQAFKPAKG